MRKYITQHVPGTYLTFEPRQTLASDWNELIRAGCRVTLRQFAAKHGLRCETWRREYRRGAAGESVPDDAAFLHVRMIASGVFPNCHGMIV